MNAHGSADPISTPVTQIPFYVDRRSTYIRYLLPLTTRSFSTELTIVSLRTISIALSMLCWESTTPVNFTPPQLVIKLISYTY